MGKSQTLLKDLSAQITSIKSRLEEGSISMTCAEEGLGLAGQ